jgi:hypothetical protein
MGKGMCDVAVNLVGRNQIEVCGCFKPEPKKEAKVK